MPFDALVGKKMKVPGIEAGSFMDGVGPTGLIPDFSAMREVGKPELGFLGF